ncbi:MAG: kelch repeat-containing protein [Planctomycetota bacterium]
MPSALAPPQWSALLLIATTTLPAQAFVHRDASQLQAGQAAFDPARGRLVTCATLAETWECDGSSWFPRAAQRGGWMDARLVWADARVLAFAATLGQTAETWTYDGFAWSRRPLAGQPPARTETMLAYDIARGRAVLFAGTAVVGPNYYLTDTWEWDGTSWAQQAPTVTPPWRRRGAMAFDPVRSVTVLFGGDGQTGARNDTWEWDGVNWSLRAPTASPSPRLGSAMTFDLGRAQIVLHGGLNGSGLLSDLWSYDGVTWQPIAATNAGPAAYQHSMHCDPASGELWVLVDYPFAAHVFGNGTWRAGPALGFAPVAGFPGQAAVDPGTGGVVRFGNLFSQETQVWDRTQWTTLLPQPSPPGRIFGAMWNDGTHAWLFGGWNTLLGFTYGDTWRWDGQAWTQITGPSPSIRHDTAVAYDSLHGVAVLFGGFTQSALSDTWTFDGVSWQFRSPPVLPPVRWQHGLAFDPVRGKVVMFGGTGFSLSQLRNDTWEWNGAAWTQVVTPQNPPAVGTAALGYDLRHQRMLMSQSSTQNVAAWPPDVWSFDGITWTNLTVQPRLEVQPIHSWMTLPGEVDPTVVDGKSVQLFTDRAPEVTSNGAGCGTSPLRLWVHTPPRRGSPQFGFEIEGAPVLQPMALLLALAPGNLTVGTCTIGVDPHGLPRFLRADQRGAGAVPLPLPNAPALRGLVIHGQAFALAPATPSGFAASPALRVVVGD